MLWHAIINLLRIPSWKRSSHDKDITKQKYDLNLSDYDGIDSRYEANR